MQEGEFVLTEKLMALKGDFDAQRQAVLLFPFKPSTHGNLQMDEEWDDEPGTWDEVDNAYWLGALTDDQLDELQGTVAKGEAAGHPFRGNQHVKVPSVGQFYEANTKLHQTNTVDEHTDLGMKYPRFLRALFTESAWRDSSKTIDHQIVEKSYPNADVSLGGLDAGDRKQVSDVLVRFAEEYPRVAELFDAIKVTGLVTDDNPAFTSQSPVRREDSNMWSLGLGLALNRPGMTRTKIRAAFDADVLGTNNGWGGVVLHELGHALSMYAFRRHWVESGYTIESTDYLDMVMAAQAFDRVDKWLGVSMKGSHRSSAYGQTHPHEYLAESFAVWANEKFDLGFETNYTTEDIHPEMLAVLEYLDETAREWEHP